MNSLKAKLKNIDAPTVAMSFRYMMGNAILAVFKQKNPKVPILSIDGYPTEKSITALRDLCTIAREYKEKIEIGTHR